MNKLLTLGAVAVTLLVNAQCPTPQQKSSLCNTGYKYSGNFTTCSDNDFNFGTQEPCCRLQTEISDPCNLPLEPLETKCRAVGTSKAFCPPDDNGFCNLAGMSLTWNLNWVNENKTCCDKCSCYGDPHCVGFGGEVDTGVICDARSPQPNGNCPMVKGVCLAQKDHEGKPCTWVEPAAGTKWSVALQGSQCIPTGKSYPMMDMYSFLGFSLKLTLGERSVIKHAVINDNGKQYVLSAEDCFGDLQLSNPWRTSIDGPTNNDPDWLPRSWGWVPLDAGDILWSVTGLDSKIEISIRCTRTLVRIGGRVRAGPPRLNIEQLVEPLNHKTQRFNTSGVCPTGKITKPGTNSVTDRINANGLCVTTGDDLDVAKVLCSAGTTASGVNGCKAIWCKSARSDWDKCVPDIATFGWNVVFCASKTVSSKKPADCQDAEKCKYCLQLINDFGWSNAAIAYEGTEVSSGECVTKSQLPKDLIDCQDGVRLQVEKTPGVWTPYVAVPSTDVLCNGKVEFTSKDDQDLFIYPVRVEQCAQAEGCLADKCTTEIGFTTSFNFKAVKNADAKIVDLWGNGKLICDPKQFPGAPTGCFSGNVPSCVCN